MKTQNPFKSILNRKVLHHEINSPPTYDITFTPSLLLDIHINNGNFSSVLGPSLASWKISLACKRLFSREKSLMLFSLMAFGLSFGCSSQPVLPEKDGVKVSRAHPHKECRELGKVRGNSLSHKAKAEELLEDLKQEVANKGGNYLLVQEYSEQGSSATGLAFQCP